MGFDPQLGFVTESHVVQENLNLQARLSTVEESYDEAAAALLRMRTEDAGWNIIGQVSREDGFSLRIIKDVAKKAEVQQVGNPLLKQGFQLRFNPIFSRGFTIEGDMKPRYERKLNNLSVQETLLTADAHDALERTCFNVGNLFVVYNRATGDMMRIPLEQITNRAVDPDLTTRTAYYLWSRTRVDFDGTSKPLDEWIPVVEWAKSGKDTVDEIAHHPVNHDWVIIDMRVNVPTTGHWGIPDSFAALPYAWAYSEYIRDAASLLKAYNLIAWRVVGKSPKQAQAAGVALAANRKTGGTATMTSGTQFDALPKAGLIDMADGRALAAMVASALNVPTSALIATVEGAAAAAIQSLDGPTVAMARARQERWIAFYERVFLAMDIDGLTINFPKITEDPIHRQISSLATARTTGGIWADEYREAVLEALSIKPLHGDSPSVEEYAQAQNALSFLKLLEGATTAIDSEADPLSRLGNSGVSGRVSEIDNTNRNADTAAGSGTQTDLIG